MSCGNGSMQRTRLCDPGPACGGQPCRGSAVDLSSCFNDDCPGTISHPLSFMLAAITDCLVF